jgi:signal transduction histidine kinase
LTDQKFLPLYHPKDKNGVKILQEQLKAAMSSVEGGYSSYIWHEAAFDKDIEYISFSRALKEWNWKIGTGIYVGKINEEIENRRKAFAQKRFNDLWISIAFVLLFVSIASIGAFLISKRMDSVFSDMNSELETNG